MKQKFNQGFLDSLCGIYSILNADSTINQPPFLSSQTLFNNIIEYLDERGILSNIIINGTDHKVMRDIFRNVVGERIPLKITNKRGIDKLNDWWYNVRMFLEEKEHRAIILSLGGKAYHLTCISRVTDRSLVLVDSSKMISIKKSQCAIQGYPDTDKYIVYPSQCWYLGKE